MSNLKIADLNGYETELFDASRIQGGISQSQYLDLSSILDDLDKSGNGTLTKYFYDKNTGLEGTIVSKKTDNSKALAITATTKNGDADSLFSNVLSLFNYDVSNS